MKGDLIVLSMALTLAATAQELWPPLPLAGGKPPWLMAVALYYGAERGTGLAVTAAALAGLWLDGLSGDAIGVSVVVLGAALPLLHWLRRVFPAQGGRVAALAGAGIAPLLLLATALILRLAGGLMRPAWSVVLLRMAMAVPLGAALTWCVRLVLTGLDRVMGNIPLGKEPDAIEWSQPG